MSGTHYRFQSLTVNGYPVAGALAKSIALEMWDIGARHMLRRLYRHHLPKRLRRKK